MTEPELIRMVLGAQAQDQDSIEALLTEVQTPLYSYIANIVGPTSVDDVLQNTLIQVWRDLRWLRRPELFKPWCYRIASRTSFRWLKRNGRSSKTIEETYMIEDLPSPEINNLQLFTTTAVFLEGVSPASRAVLTLHYLHEHSLEEVAAILEIGIGTVKSRLAYGLLQLREFVQRKENKQ